MAERETYPCSERVDGPWHSWRSMGDDPYVECVWCGQIDDPYVECVWCRQIRDALTGAVRRG